MPNQMTTYFASESYNDISLKLQGYRLDPFIRQMEKAQGKNKGLIFPFARGLRFSAMLIYIIRELLDAGLHAHWGQILDSDEDYFSGECDIIIYSGKHAKRWNGGGGELPHVMDFRFIRQRDVKVVISCKSYITKNTIEIDYLNNLKNYTNNVWLFAECCGPRSIDSIRAEALRLGYSEFWPLYTWSKLTGETGDNFADWQDFISKVSQLTV